MAKRTFPEIVSRKLRSGAQVLWICISADEGRCERILKEIVPAAMPTQNMECHTWDVVHGGSWSTGAQKIKDPADAMEIIAGQLTCNGIFIMRDLHLLLNAQPNFGLRRVLIELCKGQRLACPKYRRPLVILSDAPAPHPSLSDYVTVLDFDYPTYEELKVEVFDWLQDSLQKASKTNPEAAACDPALKQKIINAMLGLSCSEATNVLAECWGIAGGFNDSIIGHIADAKAIMVRSVDGLRYVPSSKIGSPGDLGGWSSYLEFIRKRSLLYTEHATSLHLEKPRGVGLVGPPGTGKTVAAKITSKALGRDLLTLNIGEMFDSYVGNSEKKIRSAIARAKAMRNAVLNIEEVDKAFPGVAQGNSGDSGVGSRVFDTILQAMSERDMADPEGDHTYYILTMNRTQGLPPELFRTGRIDRLWATDLPTPEDRLAILRIHLAKRGIDPGVYGSALNTVAKAAENYTGAELEETIITARTNAYARAMDEWTQGGCKGDAPDADDVRPDIDDLVGVVKNEIIPIDRIDPESIKKIREFCQANAAPVSGRFYTQNSTSAKRERGVAVQS